MNYIDMPPEGKNCLNSIRNWNKYYAVYKTNLRKIEILNMIKKEDL